MTDLAAQTHAPHVPTQQHPRASDVADVLISAGLTHPGSTVWLEPLPQSQKHVDAHRVSIERGRRMLASAVLGGGLGDAVIARFALMCEMDLLARTDTGRCEVLSLDRSCELIATTWASQAGMRCEIHVFEDGHMAASPDSPRGDVPAELPTGMTVGPYRIDGLLGHGGMGVVYQVEHTLLRKPCAMKVLRGDLLESDTDSVRRFMREARAAARVRHDGIVDVTDFGQLSDGRPYLVMALLEGQPLSDIIEEEGALAPARAIEVMRQAARALSAAHQHGVVHRDFTPSNIFLESIEGTDRVTLVDFGAARVPDPDCENIPDGPPGIVLGTPYYMAPEQARGWEMDARSDIYSLGVVFFEALSGNVPFDGESVKSIVRQHVLDEAPRCTSPNEPLPDELQHLVARCLNKRPEDRFQTASELAEELDRVERMLGRTGWRRWLPT